MVKALVCGGGNGAHVLAGLGSSQPDTEVRVFTMFADEAERWTESMEKSDFSVVVHDQQPRTITSKPSMVTKDPSVSVIGCDIIMIVVPAFAHQAYLEALKPYIKPGAVVVGLPGGAGFEFITRHVLGDVAKQCTILNFESLPWACRIKEFGVSVDVLVTKESLEGAVQGEPSASLNAVAGLQTIVGSSPKLKITGHSLGTTLMTMNAIVHPSIMYGAWHNWDGQGLDEAPLFYNGIDEFSAELLCSASDEVLAVARRIMDLRPSVDLTNVIHVFDWDIRCYGEHIPNKTSLYHSYRSNRKFEGLTHPMTAEPDGKLRPDFNVRYLTEDIPYGLVVMRGIAEIVNVPTPVMDKIILWAQDKIHKEYLVNGKLAGRDIMETRSPQRYGFHDLDTLLGL